VVANIEFHWIHDYSGAKSARIITCFDDNSANPGYKGHTSGGNSKI